MLMTWTVFFTDIENAIRAGTRFVMLKQAAARWPRHKLRTRPFLFHFFHLIAVAFSIVSPFYRVHYATRHKVRYSSVSFVSFHSSSKRQLVGHVTKLGAR